MLMQSRGRAAGWGPAGGGRRVRSGSRPQREREAELRGLREAQLAEGERETRPLVGRTRVAVAVAAAATGARRT